MNPDLTIQGLAEEIAAETFRAATGAEAIQSGEGWGCVVRRQGLPTMIVHNGPSQLVASELARAIWTRVLDLRILEAQEESA